MILRSHVPKQLILRQYLYFDNYVCSGLNGIGLYCALKYGVCQLNINLPYIVTTTAVCV